MVEKCKLYWWTNLLYINNLYPGDESKYCISWVWYLANDMQFFIVSPFLIHLYCKHWKLGYIVLSILILTSCIITFSLAMKYKLVATVLGGSQDMIYIKPWCWFGAYGIGGLLGYFYFEYKNRSKFGFGNIMTVLFDTLKDNSILSWMTMLIGTGLLCFIVFITTPSYLWQET